MSSHRRPLAERFFCIGRRCVTVGCSCVHFPRPGQPSAIHVSISRRRQRVNLPPIFSGIGPSFPELSHAQIVERSTPRAAARSAALHKSGSICPDADFITRLYTLVLTLVYVTLLCQKQGVVVQCTRTHKTPHKNRMAIDSKTHKSVTCQLLLAVLSRPPPVKLMFSPFRTCGAIGVPRLPRCTAFA